MNKGYLKLWRKIEDSVSWNRGLMYQGLMVNFLQRANWKKSTFQGVDILPGQFAISMTNLSVSLNVPRSTLQRMVAHLEADDFVKGQNVGNRFMVFTIINWHTYQQTEEKNGQPMGDQRLTDGQQMGTSKEDKNISIKNKNKNSYAPNPVGFSAESGTLVCTSDIAKNRKQNKEPPPAEHLTGYFLPVKSENMSKVAYLKAENWDSWVKTFGEDMCLGCLRHAYSWLLDNPSKAKTVGGIHKFFGAWLDKEQNKGTPPRASPTFAQGRIASSRNGNSYNDGSKRDYGQSDFGALEGAVATGGNA